MRTALRVSPAGAPWSGMDLAVLDVRTDWWREFWLVSKENGGAYTLDVYKTRAHATAGTNRLASGTHAAGESQVTMIPEFGAAFDVSPMTVTVRAAGATPDTLIVWTENPAGVLVQRIAALLDKYRDVHEMLEGAVSVKVAHQLPEVLPCVGVSSGSYSLEGQVQQYEQGVVQVELHAWVSRLQNLDAYEKALAFGSALVAIAEEQRTWGGMAIDSTVLSPAQIGIELAEGGGAVYHALVPIRVQFADLVGTRQASSDEYGTGGVYAASLT